MSKNISFIIVLFFICTASFAHNVKRKVVDTETGAPVPFVTVLSSERTIGAYADIDGVFSIELKDNLTYTLSQIGYKSVTLSSQQLSSEKPVQMEALPFELNPVVIRPDDAYRDIYRAIDSTYKRIPRRPFYQRCYRQEVLQINGKTVENAKAIIDTKVPRIFAPGKGAYYANHLKGLDIHIDGDPVHTRPKMLLPICFFNQFIVGFKPKQEKNVIFTRIRAMDEDTNTLISYYPKPDHSDYSSGRFFIDRKTWTILRTDWFLDSKALIHYNSTAKQYLFHENNIRFYFTIDGILSKAEYVLVYSLKDNPNKVFTWTTTHVYTKLTEWEEPKKLHLYHQRKFILQQRPLNMPDFEKVFQQGFFR